MVILGKVAPKRQRTAVSSLSRLYTLSSITPWDGESPIQQISPVSQYTYIPSKTRSTSAVALLSKEPIINKAQTIPGSALFETSLFRFTGETEIGGMGLNFHSWVWKRRNRGHGQCRLMHTCVCAFVLYFLCCKAWSQVWEWKKSKATSSESVGIRDDGRTMDGWKRAVSVRFVVLDIYLPT